MIILSRMLTEIIDNNLILYTYVSTNHPQYDYMKNPTKNDILNFLNKNSGCCIEPLDVWTITMYLYGLTPKEIHNLLWRTR